MLPLQDIRTLTDEHYGKPKLCRCNKEHPAIIIIGSDFFTAVMPHCNDIKRWTFQVCGLLGYVKNTVAKRRVTM
jgi:hypothetical protein